MGQALRILGPGLLHGPAQNRRVHQLVHGPGDSGVGHDQETDSQLQVEKGLQGKHVEEPQEPGGLGRHSVLQGTQTDHAAGRLQHQEVQRQGLEDAGLGHG